MKSFWHLIYDYLILPSLTLFFHAASYFNDKIKKGIDERRKLFENLIINLHGLDRRKKMIWFHSASMGEFEQAKPIIERIKKEKNVNIIVTFFSPSGYENSKNYPHADIISYSPLDSRFNANRFIKFVQPDVAVFMRYDLWPNMLRSLKEKEVPVVIADATLNADSKRKWPVSRSFHKAIYSHVARILTVSENDKKNFMDFDLDESRITAVGDTRFDRVFQKSQGAKVKKLINEDVFEGKTVFVAGSSWEADENVILRAVEKVMQRDKDLIFILVPHEPTIVHLEKVENYFNGKFDTIRFSYFNSSYNGERVILVDSIGILLTLYYYADFAYVGGSFKQGVHNVLEPAVYGIPVIYGPKHTNSQEAVYMAQIGAGTVIKNDRQAYRIIRTLASNPGQRKKQGEISYDYIHKNTGATEKIIENLYKYI